MNETMNLNGMGIGGQTATVVNNNAIEVENIGCDAAEVDIFTTGPWQVYNVPDWINVEPLSGYGNDIIVFSVPNQNFNLIDN